VAASVGRRHRICRHLASFDWAINLDPGRTGYPTNELREMVHDVFVAHTKPAHN
jgi:hypothetical protein